jgi:O-antigen ligase
VACEPRGLRYVLLGWLGGFAVTVVLGLAGIILFYLGVRDPARNVVLWNYGSVPVGSYPRVAVFFANANMTCSYLLVGLALLPAALQRATSPRLRHLLVALGVTGALVTVFTLSTGLGGLALGGALGWILWSYLRGRLRPLREGFVGLAGAAGAVTFVVITVFLLVPRGHGDVRLGPVDLDFETSGRVDVWRSALATFADHPVTGAGLGVNVSETRHARAVWSMENWGSDAMKSSPTIHMEAHNVWLNILGQVGLLGLTAFAILVAVLVMRLLGKRPVAAPLDLTRIGLLAGLVGAVFYHGFFAALEESRQVWFLFGMIGAVTARSE